MKELPVFEMVTVWGCELEPTAVSGKAMEEGLICSAALPVGGVRPIWKLGGAEVSVGWKGGVGGVSAKRAEVFRVGFLARLRSAEIVLVGAGLGVIVVREKSVPQRDPSPAVPPVELMQAAAMSASVFS